MRKKKFPIIYKSVDIVQSKKNKIKTKINKKKILLKENIKKNFVVIKVEYSNLNYKDFSVPLTVDFGFGDNWGQAH